MPPGRKRIAWTLPTSFGLGPLAAAALVVSARADAPPTVGLPLTVGVFGGWHATSGDLDVLGDRVRGNEPEAGPAFGARLAWRLHPSWAAELALGGVPAGKSWLVPVVAELQWWPLEGRGDGQAPLLSPLVGVGAGVYAGVGAGGDVDLLLSARVGLAMRLSDIIRLRLDVGLWASDAVEGALAFSPHVTVGLDILAWRTLGRRASGSRREPVPVPRGCPAGVDVARCGDSDGDEVIDAYDRCPVDPGLVDGCPDPDGDGVLAPHDGCPERAGPTVEWGCPVRPR